MVDLEVENTLREIRERVRAEAGRAEASGTSALTQPGANASDLSTEAASGGAHPATTKAADALARLESNLATAERAWNRLPPLMSNRAGWTARLELRVKRLIKRATHWFTWEQVNFNSSVYHSLRDARSALSAYEQHLATMQSEISSLRQAATQAEVHRAQIAGLNAQLSELTAKLDSDVAQLRHSLMTGTEALRGEQRAFVENLRGEQQAFVEGLRREQQARVVELQSEQRERIENLLDEQRVCFKQLSLETSERAVLQDRARRDTEARLEEIRQKVLSDE